MVRLLPLLVLPLAAGAISFADLREIAGGIIEGFLPNQTAIKRCIKETDNALSEVERAVRDLEKESASAVLDGLQGLASAMQGLPIALTPCDARERDVQQIVDALEQISSPSEFVYRSAQDLIINGHNIYKEVVEAVNDYVSQQYEDFGVQIGKTLHQLIANIDEMFAEFEQRFAKAWATEEEREAAKQAFAKNLLAIKRSNEVDDGSAVYSHLTPFADISAAEFSQRNGFRPSLGAETSPVLPLLDLSTLPESMDWRMHGAVNSIKNQGACGSCWAFATVANIEGAGFVTTGKLLSLSEQELVDCDRKTGDLGCNGGLPSNAYKDMVQASMGLERESDYPYKASDGKCKMQASAERAFITGWQQIIQDEDQIAAAVAKFGPLAIGINAGPMQWYHHGIANPWNRVCDPKKLDHGVAIVGYGVSDMDKYWLIRNSWGVNWGESGYYRIIRGVNKCGLATMVTTATGISVKGSHIVV